MNFSERRPKTILPEAKIMGIVTKMIQDNNWVINLNSTANTEIQKKFNEVSEKITTLIEKRKVENKNWEDVLIEVQKKQTEWLEFKMRYDKHGNLKKPN